MPLPTRDPESKAPGDLPHRYAMERRRQLLVLVVLAAAVLMAAVWKVGVHNVFLPGWWRVDLP